MELVDIMTHLGTYVSLGKDIHHHHHHFVPPQSIPPNGPRDGSHTEQHSETIAPEAAAPTEEEDGGSDVSGDEEESAVQLRKLPTASRIEEIIMGFKDFLIKKSMPPNLVFVESEDDIALQKNVNLIFSEAVCDRQRLIESLKTVVLEENNLMSESQKKKVRTQKGKKLDVNQKEDIKKFFPRLISLMDVLLVRCDSAKAQQIGSSDPTVAHILFVMWENVLSKMGELFSVIVYGKDQGAFDLGAFPTNWNSIIKTNNKTIEEVRVSGQEINNARLELIQKLNKRDIDIANIQSKYADMVSQLKLKESQYTGNLHLLNSLTQTGPMVRKNIKNIEMHNN